MKKALNFKSLKNSMQMEQRFLTFSTVIVSRDPEPAFQLTHTRAHNVAFLGPSKL